MFELGLMAQEVVLVGIGVLCGGIITWVVQSVLNKRGVFTYFVTHRKIGTSATDPIFGEIDVTWNGNRIAHLFLSTVEMKNESMRDYENVVVTSYTSDTIFLSESTSILDTPHVLEWSDEYKQKLRLEAGQQPNNLQKELCNRQREHIIRVFNRGQTITINYLNAATSEKMPSVWLSVTVKGAALKFQMPPSEFLGVPQDDAALAGVLVGIVALPVLVVVVSSPWLLGFGAMIYGFFAQVPGAYLIRGFRAVRSVLAS